MVSLEMALDCEGDPELLFTENESNATRLWHQANPSPYVKDAFHEYVVSGNAEAVNPSNTGTRAAAHCRFKLPAAGSKVVRLRLSAKPAGEAFGTFDKTFAARLADADEFYDCITPDSLNEDERRVHRQALAAGMQAGRIEVCEVEHTPEAVDAWAMELSRRYQERPIAVALEQVLGSLVFMLTKYKHLVLFPIHPATLANYRKASS